MTDDITFPVSKLIKKFNRLGTQESNSERGSTSDERQELLNRLRLSRDELDSYIRHTKRVINEKKQLENENDEMRTKLDVYALKIQRLEKQENTLTRECNDLLKMVCEFCPAKDLETTSVQDNEGKVIEILKNSIFTMLEERHLNSVVTGKTEEQLAARTAELAAAQNILVSKDEEIDSLRRIISNLSSSSVKKSQSLSSGASAKQSSSIIQLNPTISSSEDITASMAQEMKIDDTNWIQTEESYNVEEIVEWINDVLIDINSKISNFNNNLSINLNTNDNPIQIIDGLPITIDSNINNCEIYWQYFKSNLSSIIEQLTSLITNMSSKIFELTAEHALSAKEVSSLKYALSCRIELQNIRMNSQNTPSCNCKQEIEELKFKITNLILELKNKQIELDEANEKRLTLLQLMAIMDEDNDKDKEEI